MTKTLKLAAIIASIILLSGTLGIVFSNSASAAPATKVTICHFPPGNQPNVQIITVGFSSVAPHVILHGDYLFTGTCGEQQCKVGCTFFRVVACSIDEHPFACFERNFDSIDQCSQACDE